jgi:hypothetical protein
MGCAALKSAPAIRLQIRCENCMREKEKVLALPTWMRVPSDLEELAESGLLNNLAFDCRHCGSIIGHLVSFEGENSYE